MLCPLPLAPSRPLVSVVVPAYNAERWLGKTLLSACSQSLQDIEILVVDDGSIDGTAAVAESFIRRDPRVRLIRRENGGVGAARNTGIAAAKGRYIAPLDADDIWHPLKLESQVECMESGGEDMGFSYCWSEKIDLESNVIAMSFPFETEGWVRESLILRNFVGSASVPMFRASALEKSGLYLSRSEQAGVQGCEDWDLCLRLAESFRVGLVRQTLVGYRQVPGCMSLDAASMAKSYEVAMQRAKERNPDIARAVFRQSAGIFYSYLVSKCCAANDHAACLRAMVKAIAADPKLIANRRFHRMGLKSLMRLLAGSRRGSSCGVAKEENGGSRKAFAEGKGTGSGTTDEVASRSSVR